MTDVIVTTDLVLKVELSPELQELLDEVKRLRQLQENAIGITIEQLQRDYRLRVNSHGEVEITKRNYAPAKPRPAPTTPPSNGGYGGWAFPGTWFGGR